MDASPADVVQRYRPLSALVPAHWQSGWTTSADGARIGWTRTGVGPPVLLVHGVQGSGLNWLRTAQALEADYDVVMPDVRGHGRSSRMAGPVAVDVLVDDLRGLIAALKLEQPVVVGHSMGADLAGRLAASGAARALVLVDPALRNVASLMRVDLDNPPLWMAALYATMRALGTQSHAERMASGLRLLPPGTPTFAEADYVSLVDGMAEFDLEFYRSALGMGYLFEDEAALRAIRCPALLLTARSMLPGADVAADAARLQRMIPQLQHIHVADSGHFIMFEQYDRFVAALRAFLARNAGG